MNFLFRYILFVFIIISNNTWGALVKFHDRAEFVPKELILLVCSFNKQVALQFFSTNEDLFQEDRKGLISAAFQDRFFQSYQVGHNILHIAVIYQDKHKLKFFLDVVRMDPNKKNNNHNTPLHLICNLDPWNHENPEKQFDMVHLLLKHGANPNVTNSFKESPFKWACEFNMKNNLPLVRLLLAYGASIFVDGKSILNSINQSMYPELYDLILEAQLKETGNYY